MTIYIYGSESFKNEINEVLRHSNIKFRLDDRGEIKELNTLDELKKAIEDNPDNIYLIDDSKIIKKNILTEKIKFLNPKDGIEQDYLLDHGIGDISVDSIEELSKHIIRKLDSIIEKEDNNIDDIQESIIEIVDGAYEQDLQNGIEDIDAEEEIPNETSVDENQNSDENEVEEITLDDELSALLSSSKGDDSFFEEDEDEDGVSDEEALMEILSIADEVDVPEKQETNGDGDSFEGSSDLDQLLVQLEESHKEQIKSTNIEDEEGEVDKAQDYDDLKDVMDQIEERSISEEKIDNDEVSKDLSFDDNLDNIEVDKKGIDMEDINTQGENMSDEFSEFDTLSEDDILAALNDVNKGVVTKQDDSNQEIAKDDSSAPMDVSSNDVAKLITQLLNNKTLEITIKVKE